MTYIPGEDWQQQSPAWREWQIHNCLCGISTLLEQLPAASEVTLALATQSAAIGATSLFTPAEEGWYQIGWNAAVTRAATSSSTLGQFQIRYTDPNDSVQKITPTQNNVTATAGNTTASCISGTFTIYVKAGTSVDYVMGYVTSGATTMQYDLRIIAKKLL